MCFGVNYDLITQNVAKFFIQAVRGTKKAMGLIMGLVMVKMLGLMARLMELNVLLKQVLSPA